MNFAIIFSIIALSILFVINLAEYDVSYVKSQKKIFKGLDVDFIIRIYKYIFFIIYQIYYN